MKMTPHSGHRYCMFSQQFRQKWVWKLDLAGILWMWSGAHQPSFDILNELVHGLFWPWSGRVSSLIVSDGVTGQEAVVMVWLCGNSQLWLAAGNPAQWQQGSTEPWQAAVVSLLPHRLFFFFFLVSPCHVLNLSLPLLHDSFISPLPSTGLLSHHRPVPLDKWCSQDWSSSVTLPLVGFQTHAGTEWRKALGWGSEPCVGVGPLRQWWTGNITTFPSFFIICLFRKGKCWINWKCSNTSKESSPFLKQVYFRHAKYRRASNSAGFITCVLRAHQIKVCLKHRSFHEMNINLRVS